MLELKDGSSAIALDGYTVIIPSICVGNAAQLACDLLIASKKLKRIGNIRHPAIIPIFGPSAYQHDQEKASGCEVYESKGDKLLVIQFRSPLISTHAFSFNKELANLVAKAQRVVILSGSFGFEKRIIDSSPYEYCVTKQFKETHNDQLQAMKWKEFTGEIIYGGGNGMQLFRALEEGNVPVLLLFRYLLEGDNSTDASLIIRELNELCNDFLEIDKTGGSLKLTVPISWNFLFGNDVGELIF